MKNVKIFRHEKNLMQEAARTFVQTAEEAIGKRGRFSVVLSGGNTPASLYRLLASEEFRHRVDWSRTHVFWGDERCVPPEDPRSNYGMALETLLSRVPIPAENIHRIRGEKNPEEAACLYEESLHEFFSAAEAGGNKGRPAFDLLFLGLGEDGHTASLFPGAAVLQEKTRWVSALYVDPLRSWRITLSPVAIHSARRIIFLVTGKAKADILRRVLEERPDERERLPAQSIGNDEGDVHWLVDRDAAALLPPLSGLRLGNPAVRRDAVDEPDVSPDR